MIEDDRKLCIDCAQLIAAHCTQPKRAGLMARYGKAEIGPELAQLMQRCPAHKPRTQANV